MPVNTLEALWSVCCERQHDYTNSVDKYSTWSYYIEERPQQMSTVFDRVGKSRNEEGKHSMPIKLISNYNQFSRNRLKWVISFKWDNSEKSTEWSADVWRHSNKDYTHHLSINTHYILCNFYSFPKRQLSFPSDQESLVCDRSERYNIRCLTFSIVFLSLIDSLKSF